MIANRKPETLRRQSEAREWLRSRLGEEESEGDLKKLASDLQKLARKNHLRFWRADTDSSERRNCAYSLKRFMAGSEGMAKWAVLLIEELRHETESARKQQVVDSMIESLNSVGSELPTDLQPQILASLQRIEGLLEQVIWTRQ